MGCALAADSFRLLAREVPFPAVAFEVLAFEVLAFAAVPFAVVLFTAAPLARGAGIVGGSVVVDGERRGIVCLVQPAFPGGGFYRVDYVRLVAGIAIGGA